MITINNGNPSYDIPPIRQRNHHNSKIYSFLSNPYLFSLQEQLSKSYLRIPGSMTLE